jgi:hypothetical protein
VVVISRKPIDTVNDSILMILAYRIKHY